MTEIASNNRGRTIPPYELLDETTQTYGISRREAHDAIHAFVDQLIADDGQENVITSQRPIRPQLEKDNPYDRDRDQWLTLTPEATHTIRTALAATYAPH